MARISFDAVAADAVARAASDPDTAAEALLIAARYLRAGEPVPANLAAFLADAIEASMVKPAEHRLRAFGLELHLIAENRRPAADEVAVALRFDSLTAGGLSRRDAEAQCAAEFGISESTAARCWRKYRDAINNQPE